MRFITPSLLILGLFLFGIIGLFLFDPMNSVYSHFCPISANNCLSMDNGLAVAVHHLSGWQKMFEAILVLGQEFVLTFVIFFSSLFFLKDSWIGGQKISFNNYYRRFINRPISKFYLQFFRWLALQNKKDSYSPAWAYDASKFI